MNEVVKRIGQKVKAEDLIGELTQDTIKSKTGKPLLPLSNARVVGRFDLKHLTIEKPVEIRHCEFDDEVDLRYCEFKQMVDLSGCTFHKKFNSGDTAQSYTIYRKDFIADGAIFEDVASFNTAKSEAGMHLNRAEFRSKEDIDFVGVSVDKTLELINAHFAGGAFFNSVHCGVGGLFRGARFWNKSRQVTFEGAFFKTLNCEGATFNGPVTWDYVKCEGNGTFENVRFQGEYVTFFLASFGTLDCQYAKFYGLAAFNSVKCEGSGLFGAALFAGPSVDFTYASFGTALDCTGAIFGRHAPLSDVGRAVFENLDCKFGVFPGVKFLDPEQEVSFRDASFGVNLNFESKVSELTPYLDVPSKAPAVFNGPARFDRVECKGTGKYSNVRFKDTISGVSFESASFGTLDCTGAEFKGPVGSRSLKCSDDAVFDQVQFESTDTLDFSYASLGADFRCDNARFNGPAFFIRLKCGGSGLFRQTKFECAPSPYDPHEESSYYTFDLAKFGVNLSFQNSLFARSVSLQGTYIEQQLQLSKRDFQGDVGFKRRAYFRSARIGMLVLDENFSIASESLDLRDCRFEKFLGDDLVAEQFSKAQVPDLVTRDPYLQLEQYYRSIGDEIQAKTTYYMGRCHLRDGGKYRSKQANSTSRVVRLRGRLKTKPTSWADWCLKWLTGYGVKTHRLLIPVVAVLLIGMVVFSSENALESAENEPSAESQTLSQDKIHSEQSSEVKSSQQAKETNLQDSKRVTPKLPDRIAYNLDLFLPLDLTVADKWEPQRHWREFYVVFHSLVGWLLIPLLVASLAGIIRRQ